MSLAILETKGDHNIGLKSFQEYLRLKKESRKNVYIHKN